MLLQFWTENFDIRVSNHRLFIDVQGSLIFLGQNNRRKKEGWKPFDAFLVKQGFDVDEHFLKVKNCQRQFLSVESFLALLFGGHCLQDSDGLLGREERLRANLRIQELRARCSQSLTQQHVDAKRLIHGVEMDNHDHGEEIENERPFKFDGERDEVVAKSRQICFNSKSKCQGK